MYEDTQAIEVFTGFLSYEGVPRYRASVRKLLRLLALSTFCARFRR